MDRCPNLIGLEPKRACRAQLEFYTITNFPEWFRWMSCSQCGAFIPLNEKGMDCGIFMRFPPEARMIDDERSGFDGERPDSVRKVPKVQPRRPGQTIGAYQL